MRALAVVSSRSSFPRAGGSGPRKWQSHASCRYWSALTEVTAMEQPRSAYTATHCHALATWRPTNNGPSEYAPHQSGLVRDRWAPLVELQLSFGRVPAI